MNKNQLDHLMKWLLIVLILVLISFFFSEFNWAIVLIFSLLFLGALVLRFFHRYPSKEEPLILDISSGVLGLMGSAFLYFSQNKSSWILIGIL